MMMMRACMNEWMFQVDGLIDIYSVSLVIDVDIWGYDDNNLIIVFQCFLVF